MPLCKIGHSRLHENYTKWSRWLIFWKCQNGTHLLILLTTKNEMNGPQRPSWGGKKGGFEKPMNLQPTNCLHSFGTKCPVTTRAKVDLMSKVIQSKGNGVHIVNWWDDSNQHDLLCQPIFSFEFQGERLMLWLADTINTPIGFRPCTTNSLNLP